MAFLKDKVNTFVRWDLVRFFNDNPHAMDTAENIAQYTGRDVHEVETELLGLVEDNILRMTESNGRRIFSLTTDQTTRDLIRRFVLACDNREFRVNAINQVIRSMR
nr:MAG: hypothetical protein DIU68_13455 [Chloroflexota bacterium]